MNFTELISVYRWSLPVLALLAGALAFSGTHLSARGKTLLSLNASQGAEVGTLVMFIVIFQNTFDKSIGATALGLLGACGGAMAAGWLATKFQNRFSDTKGDSLFSLWILFFAGTQILIASHPALESHFARALVGDITTMTDGDLMILASACSLLTFVFFFQRHKILRATFQQELMNRPSDTLPGNGHLFFLALTALSTWATGFLLTCAFLFLPTTLLSLSPRTGARRHIRRCVVCSTVSAPLGMLVSLWIPQIPTVPVICMTLAGVAIFLTFIQKRMA